MLNLTNFFSFTALVFFVAVSFLNFFNISYDGVSFFHMSEQRILFDNLSQYGIKFFVFPFFLLFFIYKFSICKDHILFSTLVLYALFSILLSSNFQFSFIFGVVFTFFIFEYQLLNGFYSRSFISFSYNLLLFLTFLPLVFLFFIFIVENSPYHQFSYPQLFFYDGVRGFTLDNVHYGFLSGVAFLLSLYLKKSKFVSSLLFFSILLSNSFAVAISVFISFFYFYRFSIKPLYLFLLLSIGLIVFAYNFFYYDFNPRFEIISNFIEYLISDVHVLFLGKSAFFSSLFGHQPHNLFLQSLLNFGLIFLILYLSYMYLIFSRLRKVARSFALYLLIFGLFHSGFDAFVLTHVSLFSYFLISNLNGFVYD